MMKRALWPVLVWTITFGQTGFAFSPAPVPAATRPGSGETSALAVAPDDDDFNIGNVWLTAGEDAARCLPETPSPDLSAEEVITGIFRGLQFNNVPEQDSGFLRCYEFMDLACKKLVTGYGNVPEERTLEKFLGYAAQSPKLLPFVGAASIRFGETSRIPKTQTRGEIITMPLRVLPDGKKEERAFMVRLQKQRRPPLAGAYIVTDVIDVATVESISRPLNSE
eukprot:CAMPEP_0194322096 /NCGR_PEP_ID=MMETSP0171-20130528/18288_1 /TAXON_ID=218684 /ORGANISM="Corethron pennatum, Strain L29A3" /LENGTH=222 /DNA_ID=CAMNT_0039080265 /DNA_START=38 /DNA_END=706 /DNA_ORIENTATION=-